MIHYRITRNNLNALNNELARHDIAPHPNANSEQVLQHCIHNVIFFTTGGDVYDEQGNVIGSTPLQYHADIHCENELEFTGAVSLNPTTIHRFWT